MNISAIVFDFYGTLGREDEDSPDLPEGPLRNGTRDLLRYLKQESIPISLFTDYPCPATSGCEKEQRFIKDILIRWDIDCFDKIYTGSDCDKEWLKDLGKVSRDYGIPASEILLIGNSNKDEESAEKYGTEFRRVPTYLKGDDRNIRDLTWLITGFTS